MITAAEAVSATRGRLVWGDPGQVFSGVSIDSRTVGAGELFVALRGERFDGHDFLRQAAERGAAGAVVQKDPEDPSSFKAVIRVGDGRTALQEIARYHRLRFSIPVIAVTGSNGKTTTKEMAAGILGRRFEVLKNEGNFNNDIGLPLTLLRLSSGHRAAVVELGINRPGEMARLCEIARPQVGLITNIGPTHLAFLKDEAGVARAKGELLEALPKDGTAILNRDDRHFEVLARRVKDGLLTFGFHPEADVSALESSKEDSQAPEGAFRLLVRRGAQKGEVPVALRAVGRHNLYNALGAAAVGILQGAALDDVRAGLEAFRPAALRSELSEVAGLRILNDAYNANPASMRAALKALSGLRASGRKIAVLGDMLELGEAASAAHRELGEAAARAGVDVLIAVGEFREEVSRGALGAGMEPERIFLSADAEAAAPLLSRAARPGDLILLKGSRGVKMERALGLIVPDRTASRF